LITNIIKSLIKNKLVNKNIKNDLNDIKVVIDNLTIDNLLEFAKKSFLEL